MWKKLENCLEVLFCSFGGAGKRDYQGVVSDAGYWPGHHGDFDVMIGISGLQRTQLGKTEEHADGK